MDSPDKNLLDLSKEILLDNTDIYKSIELIPPKEISIFNINSIDFHNLSPLLSIWFDMLSICDDIKGNFTKKKLLLFLKSLGDINMSNDSEQNQSHTIEKDLELILTFIEKQIDCRKSIMLANAWRYKRFEKKSHEDFLVDVLTIDQIFISDIKILKRLLSTKNLSPRDIKRDNQDGTPPLNRLYSVGLVTDGDYNDNKYRKLSDYGRSFYRWIISPSESLLISNIF